MSESNNPFIRGYQNLHVKRSLLVAYEGGCPPIWRQLHPSQAHLRDDQVALLPCLISADFVLIAAGQEIRPELEAQCPAAGIVLAVVYVIEGEDFNGRPIHLGDTYSAESARDVVRRLRFKTGVYSRAWEISSAHLTDESWRYLANLADLATPEAFLFVAFRIPYCAAIGIKLIATPWTTNNLEQAEGISLAQLQQIHRNKGLPPDLAHLIELAGQADVRFLIVDADAAEVPGLPLAGP